MFSKVSSTLKKTPFLMLVVVLLMIVTAITAFAAAGDDGVITVGTATAEPGETDITIPVEISNNSGVAGYTLDINYPTGLTLTAIDNAGTLSAGGLFVSTPSKNVVTYSNAANITGDGVLFNLVFSVDSSAVAGDYDISISLANDDPENICNLDLSPLEVEFVAGKITVEVPAEPTAYTGSVIAAPLHDWAQADAIADAELYTGYDVSYSEGTATITAEDLKEHTNGEATTGYWVGAAIAVPQGTDYTKVQVGKNAAANLAAANLTGAEYVDGEGKEYITIYVDAKTSSVEKFYFSFDGGETIYYINLDYSGVEFYQGPLTGGETITKGGVYQLDPSATGTITISTDAAVTIVGNGAEFDAAGMMTSTANSNLFFDYTVAGADLTIQDMYISTNGSVSMIDFMGEGNTLTIAGVNVLDHGSGYCQPAGIHVGADADLLITGVGTLYFYKTSQGAGIGGTNAELNGDITFGEAGKTGPTIFAKGTKQGALIGAGSGASTTETPGTITFNSGIYNLLSNSRGAVIGGSAGGTASSGTNVYINGGTININVDYSGSAVGGGGYDAGNDSAGGYCYISGGSLRVFVDKNDAGNTSWGELTYGVNDVAITAKKLNNATDAKDVFRLIFDTTLVSGSSFSVKADGHAYYSGGLHEYKYLNQDLDKEAQLPISSTPSNWVDSDDTNIYLYLTGENHLLEVNGRLFYYLWDNQTKTFSLDDGTNTDISWYDAAEDTFTISDKADLKGLALLVNGGNDFAGKTVQLADNIALDTDGKYTKTFGYFGSSSYPMFADYYTVNADAEIWTPIGTGTSTAANSVATANYFAGTFDGQGHTISGLYTDGSARVQGLFGCVSGTVQNLTVSGCVAAHSLAGGIAAYLNGGTITNCVNNAIVFTNSGQQSGTGADNPGGETGQSRAGANGGIVGRAAGTSTSPFTISNCVNNANITSVNTSKGGRTAGMVGLVDSSADYGSISCCLNTGIIESYQYAGGMAGYIASANVPIEQCCNTGTVISHSPGSSYTGGIVACCNSDISNCYNTGDFYIKLDAQKSAGKPAHAGGIVSDFSTSKKVTNCYNTGVFYGPGPTVTTLPSSVGTIIGSGYGSVANWTIVNSLTTSKTCYIENTTTGVTGSKVFEDYAYAAANNINKLSLLTEAELKSFGAARLGSAFVNDVNNINNGFPVLAWQVAGESSTVDPTVTDGVATATVTEEDVTIVEDGVNTIDATTDGTGEVNKTELTIKEEVVTDMATAGTVTVKTDVADITFDSEALTAINSNSTGDVKLAVEKVTSSDDAIVQQLVEEGVPVFEFTFSDTQGNMVWDESGNGSAVITIPYTLKNNDNPNAVKVFYLANGKRYQVSAIYANGYVTFIAEHFSEYGIEEYDGAFKLAATSTNATYNYPNVEFALDLIVTGTAPASFSGADVVLGYDPNLVEYVSATAATGTNIMVKNNAIAGTLTLTAAGAEQSFDTVTHQFTLATITFKANGNISAGSNTADFTLSDGKITYPGGEGSDGINASGVGVSQTIYNSRHTFESAPSGVTMDTKYAYFKYGTADSGLYTDNTYEVTLSTEDIDAWLTSASVDAGYSITGSWVRGTTTTATSSITGALANVGYTYFPQANAAVKLFNQDGTIYQEGVALANQSKQLYTAFGASSSAMPAAPTAEGMTFQGWFATDSNGTATYNAENDTLVTHTALRSTIVTAPCYYKAYFTENSYAVTIPSGATIISGVTNGNATHGVDIVFSIAGSNGSGYEYSVGYQIGTGNEVELTPDTEGHYTIPGSAIIDATTIIIERTVAGTLSFIACDDFKGVPTGYDVMIFTPDAANLPDTGKTWLYKYDGEELYYANFAYKGETKQPYAGVYLFFVPSTVKDAPLTALAKITLVEDAIGNVNIAYDGDVNKSGIKDASDAQMTYNMYNNVPAYLGGFTLGKMQYRFEADMNGDGAIDISDVLLVQRAVVGMGD